MKNVYDILVNYKKVPYEFYEWDKEDDIKHIKKIPSFKVTDSLMKDIMECDVLVSKDFLEKIKNKTEVFYNRTVKIIMYACVIFNDEFSLALVFDDKGYNIGKSKLLFDESDDVVISGKNLDVTEFEYNIIKKASINSKYTRKENRIISLVSKYLKTIYEKDEKDELMYIYFECYDESENDVKTIYNKLTKSVLNADFNVINKLKSLIKVLKK